MFPTHWINALTVAMYILEYVWQKDKDITNQQLNQILYFIQATFLVDKHTPCFFNKMVAKSIGPVVPDVFHVYALFDGNIIRGWKPYPLKDYNPSQDLTSEEKRIISMVIDQVLSIPEDEIKEIISKQRPWVKAFNSKTHIIYNQSLISFFQE